MLIMIEEPLRLLGVGSDMSLCIFLFLMFSCHLRPYSPGSGCALVVSSDLLLQMCGEPVLLVDQLNERLGTGWQEVVLGLMERGGFLVLLMYCVPVARWV